MLEKSLIHYCSPTLASLKAGSLFTVRYDGYERLRSQLDYWNEQLQPKNISLTLLRHRNGTALVYVYRITQLQAILGRSDVAAFLRGYGYESTDVAYAIQLLKSRCADSSQFPHEIGIFLGYPLEDVKGFIDNAGRNCKCCGCWKVYCNECEARKLFSKFKKCRDVYLRLWYQGRSVEQLTVAA